MRKFLAVLFVFVLYLNHASAAFPKKVQIVGTVESVSETTVVIHTKTGSVKVPKNTVLTRSNLRPGEKATARVSFSQLKELNS